MSMTSPVFSRSGSDNATATRWIPLSSSPAMTPNVSEINARSVMVDSGTFQGFYVRRNAAPGTGASVTYTLVQNGVNTGITCTISDTNTTAQDITDSVSYVPGDVFSVNIQPTGTVATSNVSYQLDNTSSGQALMMSDVTLQAAANGTIYASLMNGEWVTSPTDQGTPFSTSGTIDNGFMDLSVTTGASKSWAATLFKNGLATPLVITVTNGTQSNDTSHSVSVNAGDTAYWQVTSANAPASTRIRLSCRFTPTINGESIQMGGSSSNLATSGANFAGVQGGQGVYSSTESARANWINTPYDIKKLYASVDTAPGSASWKFTVASPSLSALSCTITGTATTGNDTSDVVTPAAGVLLAMDIVGTGTPTATPAQWGYVTYRAPSVSVKQLAALGVG